MRRPMILGNAPPLTKGDISAAEAGGLMHSVKAVRDDIAIMVMNPDLLLNQKNASGMPLQTSAYSMTLS